MKKLLVGLGVLLGIVLLAVLIVPAFIPKGALEGQIEARASAALGRPVTIEGPPDIRLLPTELKVRGLQVANAEGFAEPYFLSVGEAARARNRAVPICPRPKAIA